MSIELKKSMNLYYDERADEYDEIYTLGAGPASITDPNAYKQDVIKVKEFIEKQNFKGVVFDVPCGTAFWMPSYYQNAEKIVLIDQSATMLKKAQERADTLGCLLKCKFIKLDAFQIDKTKVKPSVFFIGFFLSHLTLKEETKFFMLMKKKIEKNGKIVIVDSTWSDERARKRQKEGRQIRKLNNGTTFDIYKKYFTVNDLEEIAKRESLHINIEYFGKAFFIAVLYLV
jgi:cyclopropane fatty-acyl-phospholipid synthase-like methyltransferase